MFYTVIFKYKTVLSCCDIGCVHCNNYEDVQVRINVTKFFVVPNIKIKAVSKSEACYQPYRQPRECIGGSRSRSQVGTRRETFIKRLIWRQEKLARECQLSLIFIENK